MLETIIETVIIGAGMAGLSCARALAPADDLLVLEKSRGVGGRAATRYRKDEAGEVRARIDHGAQYFTVRQEAFQQQVQVWLEQGIVCKWSEGFHHWHEGTLTPPDLMGHPRFVAPRGMNQLAKNLAEGIRVACQHKVIQLQRQDEGWQLATEEGATFGAKRVILTMPAPQVLQLLQHGQLFPEHYAALERVTMQPCFALMVAVAQAPAWQGITCQHAVLSWLANDSSKRSEATQNIVVAHASRQYSQQHVDKDKAQVAEEMLEAMLAIDSSLKPQKSEDYPQVHRWLYAQAAQPYPEAFIDFGEGLFACGDWCGGNKLEDAFVSGSSLATYLQE